MSAVKSAATGGGSAERLEARGRCFYRCAAILPFVVLCLGLAAMLAEHRLALTDTSYFARVVRRGVGVGLVAIYAIVPYSMFLLRSARALRQGPTALLRRLGWRAPVETALLFAILATMLGFVDQGSVHVIEVLFLSAVALGVGFTIAILIELTYRLGVLGRCLPSPSSPR